MTSTYTTESHLPSPRANLQYIPVKQCELLTYKQDPEDKAVVGMLLEVLQHTSSNTNDKIRFNGQSTFHQRGNARQRRTGERQYDRMFTFANVLNPGACFVIICNTYHDTVKLLSSCSRTQEGVGNVFLIVEPDPIETFLGDSTSVPIVENPTIFFPINNRIYNVIREAKPTMPDADHTLYFCLHKQ